MALRSGIGNLLSWQPKMRRSGDEWCPSGMSFGDPIGAPLRGTRTLDDPGPRAPRAGLVKCDSQVSETRSKL